jgi:hypothetical protein
MEAQKYSWVLFFNHHLKLSILVGSNDMYRFDLGVMLEFIRLNSCFNIIASVTVYENEDTIVNGYNN